MYCRNCGRKVEEERELCVDCEANLKTQNVNNGEKVEVVEEVNYSNNKTNSQQNNTIAQSKSKVAAGLFAIFLGSLGIHNFYLGYTSKAVAQLLITVLSCGALSVVSATWALIEGILILTGSQNTDAEGNPLKD